MSDVPCQTPIGLADLLDYWLGDCDAARETRLEDHLFACPTCSDVLQALIGLGDAVRALIREGGATAVISSRFVEKLKQAGLRVNEYRLEPNSSVNCTIAPHDDLVVSYLSAPLQDVSRLDVLMHDVASNQSTRLEDIAFDAAKGKVVMLPKARHVRQLGVTTQRVALLSVTAAGERFLGEYVFNHTPYRT